MTRPLSIAAETPQLRERLARTLATLPLSFRVHDENASASTVLVSGDGDWATRALRALDAGSRAIIVSDPGMTDPETIVALADRVDQAGAVVELAERYAGDPTLLRHRADLIQHLAATSTILISQVGGFAQVDRATLDMVRTVRVLGLSLGVTHRWQTAHAVVVRGMVGDKLFEGMATMGNAGVGQRLEALGFGRTLRLSLRGDGSARPSDVRIANAKGERKLPDVFESVDRAAWQRALTALESGRTNSAALRQFADDIAMIGAL